MKQLGDVLLERGLATPEQVYEAGQEQRRVGRSMGRVLVDQGVISEADLVRALAAQIGLDYVDLGDALIDPSASALVPGAVCRRHMLVPVRFVDGKLVIAMADPANVIALDDVRSIAKVDLKPVVSTRGDVMAAIARAYRAGDELDSLSTAIEVRNTDEEDLTRIKEVVEEAPIVKFVNLLITQGIQDGASDIHIEPTEHDLRVRFRIDGVLHEMMRSPEVDPVRGHQPPEDHGRHQHRRATDPPGRATVGERLRPQSGPARGHPAHGVGREGRHAHPGQLHRHARPQGPRVHGRQLRPLPDQLPQAVRDDPGDRADRVRASRRRSTRRCTRSTSPR